MVSTRGNEKEGSYSPKEAVLNYDLGGGKSLAAHRTREK